jgi:hypothetical protein
MVDWKICEAVRMTGEWQNVWMEDSCEKKEPRLH